MRTAIALATVLFSSSALAQESPTIEKAPPQKPEMRSSFMFGAGIGMVIVGPITAVTAAAVLASAHGQVQCFNTVGLPRCMTLPANRGEIAAGGIVLSIGATMALGGIVMILLGGTRVPVESKSVWLTPGGIAGTF
jgi:hypothetical protein